MAKARKLGILVAVLVVLVAIAVAVGLMQQREERIAESGETVFELDVDSVTALSWTYGDTSLAFHKDGEDWAYDDDDAFPADAAKIGELLGVFEEFGAAFVIEDVEDYAQYGLDSPVCTIHVTAGDDEHEITLGDFSEMDSQRYVRIGDTVYLAASDPYESYEVELSDLIKNDEVPDVSEAKEIAFDGAQNYTVSYDEDGSSCCKDDVYFTGDDPLDTSNVESYLRSVTNLELDDYATYKAADDNLVAYGMDEPELTATISYDAVETADGESEAGTLVLHVSRNAEDRAKVQSTEDESDDEEVACYARVGDSPIVYVISYTEFENLTEVAYDDLRHQEIFTASFDDVEQVDVELEGESYTFTASGSGDDRTWACGDDSDVDMDDFETALELLSATEFVDDGDCEKLEIALTLHVDDEDYPEVKIELYRHDGENCLAVVDGKVVALVSRSAAVNLVEAVNGIVL